MLTTSCTAEPSDSTSVLKALPGKLDLKYRMAMSMMCIKQKTCKPARVWYLSHMRRSDADKWSANSFVLVPQNAEKVTHTKGRLLDQAVVLFIGVPFQSGNFS